LEILLDNLNGSLDSQIRGDSTASDRGRMFPRCPGFDSEPAVQCPATPFNKAFLMEATPIDYPR
jgi:hypothetical protein